MILFDQPSCSWIEYAFRRPFWVILGLQSKERLSGEVFCAALYRELRVFHGHNSQIGLNLCFLLYDLWFLRLWFPAAFEKLWTFSVLTRTKRSFEEHISALTICRHFVLTTVRVRSRLNRSWDSWELFTTKVTKYRIRNRSSTPCSQCKTFQKPKKLKQTLSGKFKIRSAIEDSNGVNIL